MKTVLVYLTFYSHFPYNNPNQYRIMCLCFTLFQFFTQFTLFYLSLFVFITAKTTYRLTDHEISGINEQMD